MESPKSLWGLPLKSIHFQKTDFLSSAKGSRPSWIWSSLCGAHPFLDIIIFKVLGDGENIIINKDPWLPKYPGMRLLVIIGPFTIVSDWIKTCPRAWDTSTITIYSKDFQTNVIRPNRHERRVVMEILQGWNVLGQINVPFLQRALQPYHLYEDNESCFEAMKVALEP
ncbi:hypothetical protein LINPERHAP1_LOCUS40256 [Linum perenne]